MGNITFKGSDGSQFIESAEIYSHVEDTPTSGNVSANLKFATRTSLSNNLIDRLCILSNGNIGIANSTPKVILDINSTDALKIPCGTTQERPDSPKVEIGQIRYNTELSTFEGYGAGNTWGSLGGIKDVNGDTYISAENSPE